MSISLTPPSPEDFDSPVDFRAMLDHYNRAFASANASPETTEPCPECEGDGCVTVHSRSGNPQWDTTETCELCEGSGRIEFEPADESMIADIVAINAAANRIRTIDNEPRTCRFCADGLGCGWHRKAVAA